MHAHISALSVCALSTVYREYLIEISKGKALIIVYYPRVHSTARCSREDYACLDFPIR